MKVPEKISPLAAEIAADKSLEIKLPVPSEEDKKELSKNQLEFALAASRLILKLIAFSDQPKYKGKKVIAEKKFIKAYNQKAFPDIYDVIGKRSLPTLRTWRTKYLKENKDYRVLARNYKTSKASSIPPEQSEVIVKMICNPNKPLVSDVIRSAINYFEAKRFMHIKSYNTYKRYIDNWIKENYADYVFYREGEKGLDDLVLPYLERDWNLVEVGDLIIMDGHVNNYEIINPFTGHPKRMMTIGAIDGRSQYLAGYEIAITENVLAIASALRRAILMLGKIPKVVYIDNGKAFTAKYFHGNDLDNLEALFARLGIKVIFAKKYHAQSKPIEVFWKWMAELERMVPTYVGTSIQMQPPRMNRGEFLHRKFYEKAMQNTTVDIFAAHRAMAWWLDEYHQRKKSSGHLKDLTPAQVFNAGKGAGIDKKELKFLMMDTHITKLYRKGIKMFGTWYWHPEIFGKQIDAGDEVRVKFDLFDRDFILVYDRNGDLVCEAFDVKKVNPAAKLLGTPEEVQEVENQLALKERLKSSVVGEAKKFLVDEIYPFVKKQLNDAKILQLPEPDSSQAVDEDSGSTSKKDSGKKKKKGNVLDRWNVPENETRRRKIG